MPHFSEIYVFVLATGGNARTETKLLLNNLMELVEKFGICAEM